MAPFQISYRLHKTSKQWLFLSAQLTRMHFCWAVKHSYACLPRQAAAEAQEERGVHVDCKVRGQAKDKFKQREQTVRKFQVVCWALI